MGPLSQPLRRPSTRRLALVPVGALSDQALARRVGSGDQRAFEALYGRYKDPLYRYCMSLLRQPQDAEEALQAAMVNAYGALASHGQRELAVRPWLYRISHNECVNVLRRRVVHEELSGVEEAVGCEVEQQAERSEAMRELAQDLATLAPRARQALVLRELSGLSHEEIGLAMGSSASVAKNLIHEARGALEQLVEGRALPCREVRRTLSDGDGRALRGRKVSAHLRACSACQAYRERIAGRATLMSAMVPMAIPAMAGKRILDAALSSVAGAGQGGAIAGAGMAAAAASVGSKASAGALALKGALAGVAAVAGAAAIAVPVVVSRAAPVRVQAPSALTRPGLIVPAHPPAAVATLGTPSSTPAASTGAAGPAILTPGAGAGSSPARSHGRAAGAAGTAARLHGVAGRAIGPPSTRRRSATRGSNASHTRHTPAGAHPQRSRPIPAAARPSAAASVVPRPAARSGGPSAAPTAPSPRGRAAAAASAPPAARGTATSPAAPVTPGPPSAGPPAGAPTTKPTDPGALPTRGRSE